jgi:transposase-like protein
VEPPHPDALLREAEEEPSYRDLREYVPVISTLRGKGFSYRDIAEWLSERGIDLDHNGVYRLYTKSLTDAQA